MSPKSICTASGWMPKHFCNRWTAVKKMTPFAAACLRTRALFFLAEQRVRLSQVLSAGKNPLGGWCSDHRTGEMLHCFYCLFALLQESPVATSCSYQICRKFKEVKKKRIKTAFPNVWNCLGYVMIIKLSKKLKNTWVFKLCLIFLTFPWGQGKRKK